MRYILLILTLVLLVIPTTGHAQNNVVPIAPCLPSHADYLRLEGSDWMQVVNDPAAFYALRGEQIQWLGYAPVGQESQEWYGVRYGFAGVNMFNYGEEFYIYLFDSHNKAVGRIEAHKYGKTQYVLYFTRLNATTDAQGLHMGYHVYANPRGGACMFWIDASNLNEALGWQ